MQDIKVEKTDYATRAVKQRIDNILEGQVMYISENSSYSEDEKVKQLEFIRTIQKQAKNYERENNTEKEYKDKVFTDVIKVLCESTTKHVKTKADGFAGMELLNNFYKFTENYEDSTKLLAQVKDYKKSKKIVELANEIGLDNVIKELQEIKIEREER